MCTKQGKNLSPGSINLKREKKCKISIHKNNQGSQIFTDNLLLLKIEMPIKLVLG